MISKVVLVLTLIFLVGPFVVILWASFGENPSLEFPPKGFTLHWYSKVVSMPMFTESLRFSLVLALYASIMALVLGLPVAYTLARKEFKGKGLIEFFTSLPVVVPGMVAGLVLLRFFVLMDVFSIKTSLLLGHTLIVLPYSVRIIKSSLLNVPEEIELAARSLGATPFKTFILVVLPSVRTAIVASFILMFIISFNNVPVSLFLTGPGVSTLPIVMMGYMEYYYDPTIAALSTILIFTTMAIVMVTQKVLGITKFM